MLFELLLRDPALFILVAVALVLSISIHEFAHAFTADKLGDPTPRYLGRITLNPVAHIDPIGMLLLVFAGFGWGRPVSFDPRNLASPRRDTALIALTGPLSNILTAVIIATFLHTFAVSVPAKLVTFLYIMLNYNIVLAIFNLLPIHPLDGFKIVAGFLKGSSYYQWLHLESYGIYILLFLVFTGTTSKIVGPLIEFSLSLLGF